MNNPSPLKTLNDLVNEIGLWSEETFGHDKPTVLLSKMAHLREEVDELSIDPRAPDDLADCIILLASIAYIAGVDLEYAVKNKMAVNRARKWHAPDARGIQRHIEPNPLFVNLDGK